MCVYVYMHILHDKCCNSFLYQLEERQKGTQSGHIGNTKAEASIDRARLSRDLNDVPRGFYFLHKWYEKIGFQEEWQENLCFTAESMGYSGRNQWEELVFIIYSNCLDWIEF